MKVLIALSIVPLVVVLPSFSPFGLIQAYGQMSVSCPDGYRQNSFGLCEPMAIMNPSLLECPDGYIKNSSGDCEWIGASSLMLNNATNQTRNEGSLSAQQPPNTGGAAPLQQQPLTPPVQQQQPYVQSQPQLAIPSPPLSSQMPLTPLPTSPGNCDPSYPGGCLPPPPN
jgi:hypothetical protein